MEDVSICTLSFHQYIFDKMIEQRRYLSDNKGMRILLYDQDEQRNKNLHRYLEDSGIQVTAAYCLKDFLSKFQNPSLKLVIIEHSRIQHYNIDIDKLLDQLGLTFTVIDYTETAIAFDFTVHYLLSYYSFPFITEQDKKTINKVKKRLEKYKHQKRKSKRIMQPAVYNTQHTSVPNIKQVMKCLTKKQKLVITKLAEKQDGIGLEELIEILDAHGAKNSKNYVQAYIYRLRLKLNRFFENEYIIFCKDHRYQLICTHN